MDTLGFAGLTIAAITSACAGAVHLLHTQSLKQQLSEQRLVPAAIRPSIAIILPFIEWALGLLALLTLIEHQDPALIATSLCALFSGFAIYSTIVLRLRNGAPCGCSVEPRPVTPWIIARALFLSLLAGLGIFASEAPGSGELLAALLATGSLATLIWVLPDALGVPSDLLASHGLRSSVEG